MTDETSENRQSGKYAKSALSLTVGSFLLGLFFPALGGWISFSSPEIQLFLGAAVVSGLLLTLNNVLLSLILVLIERTIVRRVSEIKKLIVVLVVGVAGTFWFSWLIAGALFQEENVTLRVSLMLLNGLLLAVLKLKRLSSTHRRMGPLQPSR